MSLRFSIAADKEPAIVGALMPLLQHLNHVGWQRHNSSFVVLDREADDNG